MGFSVFCHCGTDEEHKKAASGNLGQESECHSTEDPSASNPPPSQESTAARTRNLAIYSVDYATPLHEPAIRSGEVWHLSPDHSATFVRSTLTLHANGFHAQSLDCDRPRIHLPLSPFSLVQACRLHSVEADSRMPWFRLFKVSIFHLGITHFFATQGAEADTERARWVADAARAIRQLTLSLFPGHGLSTTPLPKAAWTATRLLAGYLLLCDERCVVVVYGELHAHWEANAVFAAYADERCNMKVIHLIISDTTCVSERMGVDCSCFSMAGRSFCTRTCAEKILWLRAISNVKVKVKHCAKNPTQADLTNYRAAISEFIDGLNLPEHSGPIEALLPVHTAAGVSVGSTSRSSEGFDLDPADSREFTPSEPQAVAAKQSRSDACDQASGQIWAEGAPSSDIPSERASSARAVCSSDSVEHSRKEHAEMHFEL